MNPSGFFAMVFRQKYIRRWGLMHNVCPESLSEHAMEVATLSHALATIGNRLFQKKYDVGYAVSLALFHDVPEVFTGDLPTPVKYHSDASRDSYRQVEEHAIATLLEKLPAELREPYAEMLLPNPASPEHQLVKMADKLAAYLKCVEEEKCGNHDFNSAKETIRAALDAYDAPELTYFCERFLPAFSLTLDQL